MGEQGRADDPGALAAEVRETLLAPGALVGMLDTEIQENLARLADALDVTRERLTASEWACGNDQLLIQSLKDHAQRLEGELEDSRAAYNDLVIRTDAAVAAARAEAAALRGRLQRLEALEWIVPDPFVSRQWGLAPGTPQCRFCDNGKADGHDFSCLLAAALTTPPEEPARE